MSPSLSNNLVVREAQSKVCHLLLLLLLLLWWWWCLLEILLLHLLLLHLNHPQQQNLLPHHEALHNGLDANLVCNRILNLYNLQFPGSHQDLTLLFFSFFSFLAYFIQIDTKVMSFHPLKRGLRVFSSIHFIQIDIGYEFSSIEEEGYMFFDFIQIDT